MKTNLKQLHSVVEKIKEEKAQIKGLYNERDSLKFSSCNENLSQSNFDENKLKILMLENEINYREANVNIYSVYLNVSAKKEGIGINKAL